MNIKVAKFGGTSLAMPERIQRVVNIIRADPTRTVIVVSAPGKRHRSDTKVTDLLIQLAAGYNEDLFNDFASRYDDRIAPDLEVFRTQLRTQQLSRDYIITRGEYFMAKLMSAILGFQFIDIEKTHAITIKCRGGRCDGLLADITHSRIHLSAVHNLQMPIVVPGFYGMTECGTLKAFSRGGSDISGAILARMLYKQGRNIVYENWTDVDGIFDRDPNTHPDAKLHTHLTTSQARQIINAGANVLHPSVFKFTHPVRIPVHVRNTFNPNGQGTLIVD